jgi:hypothetical protein
VKVEHLDLTKLVFEASNCYQMSLFTMC